VPQMAGTVAQGLMAVQGATEALMATATDTLGDTAVARVAMASPTATAAVLEEAMAVEVVTGCLL